MFSAVLLVAAALQQDAVPVDTTRLPAVVAAVAVDVPQDTVRRRPRAIEVSEAYHTRLIIHRIAAYASIPVFIAQYEAGQKLYDADQGGAPAPGWAKPVHSLGASAIAGIFTINTVTGAWNWWDNRNVPDHKWLRTSHALLMLGADAAFAYTGIQLADDSQNSQDKRRQHRDVALYSMGVTVGSGIIMKIFNR